MTAAQVFQWRTYARLTGGVLLFMSWFLITGAVGEIDVPGWTTGLVGAFSTGLIIWGSLRTKVEKLEKEVEARVTKDVFALHVSGTVSRLDRIEQGNDRVEAKLDRLIERKYE